MDENDYRFFLVRESGALSVIQFRLAITASNANPNEIQQEINSFVATNSCQKLVIDLSKTAYLPSTVIGMLAVLTAKGVEVHLANASPDVENVMNVMGLKKRIRVNDIEVAVAEDEAKALKPDPPLPVSLVEGYFAPCPHCEARQRVDKKQLGKTGRCQNCRGKVHIDSDLLHSATHVYCHCPGCNRELRVEIDLLGTKVDCKFCDSKMRVQKLA